MLICYLRSFKNPTRLQRPLLVYLVQIIHQYLALFLLGFTKSLRKLLQIKQFCLLKGSSMFINIHLFIAIIYLIHRSLDIHLLTFYKVLLTFFFASSLADLVEPLGLQGLEDAT